MRQLTLFILVLFFLSPMSYAQYGKSFEEQMIEFFDSVEALTEQILSDTEEAIEELCKDESVEKKALLPSHVFWNKSNYPLVISHPNKEPSYLLDAQTEVKNKSYNYKTLISPGGCLIVQV